MAASFNVGFAVTVFVFLSTLFRFAQLSSCANLNLTCVEQERQALLKFQQGFDDPQTYERWFGSWKGEDCCKWKGIGCDSITGHVIKIDLRNECDWRLEVRCYFFVVLKLVVVEFASSLVELKHLNHLDLSGQYFKGIAIPSFFGSMKQLKYLNLSNSGFDGTIPHQLGNLTNLQVLDLSAFYDPDPLLFGSYTDDFSGISLYIDDFSWISQLSSLQYIDLSGVQMMKSNGLMQVIYKLPSLLQVHLMYCGLSDFMNSTFAAKIEVLNLRGNSLSGPIPINAFQNMTSIKLLDLSENNLISSMPSSLGQLKNLMYLNLASNSFHGPIPASLGRLSTLRVLNLSSNHLKGIIPGNFSKLYNLHDLDLSKNSLEGTINEILLGNLSNLQDLRIGFNNLAIKLKPNWLPPFQLANLQLHSCTIKSSFPQWLQIQNQLIELDLSNTSIEGTIPKWFQQMHLVQLDLSDNQISGPIPKDLHDRMPKLNVLLLGNNLLNGSIPNGLCKLEGLYNLDLSKNKLSSKIPYCLGEMDSLQFINLSSNKLSGTIPNSICGSFSSLSSLNLSNSSLHGELPMNLRHCKGLAILDVGDNQISGTIPSWIGVFPSLTVLRLRGNMFNGTIPSDVCGFRQLQVLDLAQNNLVGSIPQCIDQLSGMKQVYYKNTYSRNPPFEEWDKELVNQIIKGRELEYTKNLKYMFNIDLSSNKLNGSIPEGLVALSLLVNLNLSHNRLSGKIPSNIGKLKSLESVDFSNNTLSGLIPDSMSLLTSLSHLNLSYNNFSGPIPQKNQFSTFEDDLSIYAGNPYLCGIPLKNKCSGNEPHQPPSSIGFEEKPGNDDVREKMLFYLVIVIEPKVHWADLRMNPERSLRCGRFM